MPRLKVHKVLTAHIFPRAAALNKPMDGLAMQLLNSGERVGDRADQLPNGSGMLKGLLK
jgi:hypothetical protein